VSAALAGRWRVGALKLAVPLLSVGAALLLGALATLGFGKSTGVLAEAFVDGAFGSAYAVGASLNRACILALVGIGFCWAYRARLVNVGGEGQIAIGGTCAAAVALHAGTSALPLPYSVLCPVLAAAVGGMAWGALAGAMKVRFGTNEVISTLLLSFVALWLLYAVTHSEGLLRQPMTSSSSLPESAEIPAAARIPLLGSDASPLHAGFAAMLLLAAWVWYLLGHTVFGLKLRAVGLNERAAANFGIPARLHIVVALGMAGAFSGVAGAFMVLGEQHALKSDFASGYGFDGLVVGLLARGSPLASVAYALFFGFLRSGGIALEISAGIPAAMVLLVQGLIVVTVAGASFLLPRQDTR